MPYWSVLWMWTSAPASSKRRTPRIRSSVAAWIKGV